MSCTDIKTLQNMLAGLRTAVDDSISYIYIKDLEGHYTYVNQRVQNLFGASYAEIIGKDDSHFFNLGLANQLRINDLSVIQTGEKIEREEKSIIKSTGEARIFWSIKRPVFDEQDRIVGLCGISTDITARKEIEVDLRSSKSQLSQDVTDPHFYQLRITQLLEEQKAILENRIVGIVTVRDRKIVWANLAFEKMLGYENDELISAPTRQFYSNEDAYQKVGEIYSTLQTGTIANMEVEFVRKNGENIWVDLSGSVLHPEAGESLWVFVDITQRKLAERHSARSVSLLSATLESTHDAILVVDLNNAWVLYNRRMIDLWQIPGEIIAAKDDRSALKYVLSQLEDSDTFLPKAQELNNTTEANSFDVLKFKNGKIIECYSKPQLIDGKVVGRVWSFADVTDREKSEKAFKREAKKNLALLHNASDGIHILDYDGYVLEASGSFCSMLGYERNEVIGMHVSQWDAQFIGDELMQSVRRQFVEKVRSQFETRHRRKDGAVFDVEVSGYPLELDGKPVLFNSSRDITHRKLLEKSLAATSSELQDLYDNAPCGYHSLAPDGTILRINNTELAWLGFKREDVAGKMKFADVLTPTSQERFLKQGLPKFLKEGQIKEMEFELVGKSGATKQVSVSATAIRDEQGNIRMSRSIVYDITVLKQIQAELHELTNEQSTMLNTELIGIMKLHKRLIIWENKAMDQLFGYQRNELHGQPVRILYPDESTYQIYGDQAYSAIIKGETYRTELELIKKDGKTIWLDVSGVQLNSGKNETLVMMTDITERKQSENALRKSESNFRSLAAIAPVVIYRTDANGKCVFVNDTWQKLTGFAVESALGDGWNNVLYPEDRERVYQEWYTAFESSQTFSSEYRVATSTGHIKNVLGRAIANYDESGVLQGYVGTLTDITERKQNEENLRLTSRVFESTLEGIMITNVDRAIIEVNNAFTQITGYSREEVIGKHPRFLKSEYQEPSFYIAMWQIINCTGHWSGEIWNRRKNGEVYPEWLTISAITNDENMVTHYVGIFSDVTLLKQHERQLEQIAHYDALTGIPNRILLLDRLQQALAQTRRDQKMLAICYLDLDGFKPINDNQGHETGDRVLIKIAERIRQTLRGGDTLARMGGDEFVILLLDIENIDECKISLDRFLRIIEQPIILNKQSFRVTASIGVTLFPHDHDNPDTLLRHADQAMYIAKQSGKNRFHIFDSELDTRQRRNSELKSRIEQGLKSGEFELYYQPKVAMASRQMVGVEALIRWRHPERGLLPPIEFLPIIENTEMEMQVGEWVIETALAQMDNWRREGVNLDISINIAAAHLQSPNFLEVLTQKLVRYPNLLPQQLQIEILETAALADMASVIEIIEGCIALGVRFALDDFGTGYSSLSYLRRLPADTLKIDQSFVRDMLKDQGDFAIVQGVIALARTFKRTTVAEGVETPEHFQALCEMGCDIGQGYGIARPMQADKVMEWRRSFENDQT
jgi:diguanylate cyclase (GGDEF)-like protein/PAS domain S-box-containing protein